MTDCCENGKPKDCQYCYYYGRHGCMLKVCYYDRPKPETKPVSECDDCPYDCNADLKRLARAYAVGMPDTWALMSES